MLLASTLLITIGLTTGLVALLMTGMAVGVIVSNRSLAGSCGGTGADCLCEKKERGECPHDNPAALEAGEEPSMLPPNERLVGAGQLTRALKS
ncbi:MAG: hypothetical protein AAGA54_35825 [Myxococcota bacterium]